ncbi:MAG: thioredoxin [Cytophagales bacterium]|nr:MAG: thioredoxin [Cytophagales bacterium]
MATITSDDNSIHNDLTQHPLSIVKYYAEWCGSCKLFAPKYKRLSNEERFQNIAFLDVNAETNPDARKLGNVNNLPSFAIFKNGILVATIASSKEEAVIELIEQLQNN